jgi:hypothetical protein
MQCPICDEVMPAPMAEYPEFPFCSQRCKTIDLGRWLGEGYCIVKPAEEDDDRSSHSSDDTDIR